MSGKPGLLPGAPVEVTFEYLGAPSPCRKSVRLLICSDCPCVKKMDERRSAPPAPPGNSCTSSGLARSPPQPKSRPYALADMSPPTDACARKVVPPYDCVNCPSCGTAKIISGDEWLSARKMCR